MARDTLAEAIAAKLVAGIVSGAFPADSRLMSIRKAAAHFGVSKNTVVDAYDRLVAAGHVIGRAGSGFVVTAVAAKSGGSRPRHVAEAVDIASLLSAQLDQNFEIRVGDGRPPPSWTDQSEIKRHMNSYGGVLAADADAYGSALGFLPMRQLLARRLAAQNIGATEANILLTFGANHALDLIIRAMQGEPSDYSL